MNKENEKYKHQLLLLEIVKKCLSRMSGKLSCTVLRRGSGSNSIPLFAYTSNKYQELTKDMIDSYSRKSNLWDNACIESFHSIIKREWLNRYKITDYAHAYRLVFEYLEGYYITEPIWAKSSTIEYKLTNQLITFLILQFLVLKILHFLLTL